MIYNGFINIIIDFFVGFISYINGKIIMPIFEVIFSKVFGIDNFFSYAEQFLNDYVYNSIGFAKNVIINITGIPNGFFVFISVFLMFMFGLFLATMVLRFTLNGLAIFKTGKSIIHTGGGKN